MTWIYTKIDCKTTSTTSEEDTSHNHYSALVGGFTSCSKTWSSILLLTDVRKGNVHFQPRQFAVLKWYVCVCVCVCEKERKRERERGCVCVCVQNELEICTILAYQHISSFHTMPVPQAHAHIHKPFEDGKPTELKVNTALEKKDIICRNLP